MSYETTMDEGFSNRSEAATGKQARPAPVPEPGAFVPCRFKRGDKVVIIEGDKLLWFTIERIVMDWRKGGCSYDVGYYQSLGNGTASWEMFTQSRCFLTKEELFDNL